MASRTPLDIAPLPGPATAIPAGPWPEPPSSAMVLPLVDRGRDGAAGALVLGLSSRRPFDDEYRGWCVLVAGQVSANLSNARAHENEKRRAEALAEIDRAKTAFFSNVSHEFRTPLTLMLGPIEDALTSAAGTLTGDALETVHRNALRLLKLVNTLLDFTRLEAGRVAARFELVDLAQLTADLASSFRAAIEQAGLDLHVVCPPLGGPVPVDRGMWEKIVLNLMSNALKFTLSGSITVALALEGDEIALRVTDTGVGIAPDQREKVFDRFHRIEGTAARTQEGSGIGLALVRELVTLHEGTVEVTSTPGAGSAFIVRLPARPRMAWTPVPASATAVPADVARPYVEEAVGWAPVRPTETAGAPARHAAHGPRLLIADDNADMRQYLARLFADRFDIEVAADGEAALEAARRHMPALIVADVMMPRLDGLQLVAALRADATLRYVPIILLSARAGEEARVDGLHAGADDYLVKPFSARELLARVDTQLMRARVRWLEQQQAEAASRAKDEFLAMLGHELRNPLAPILTALQILRLRGVTGAEREHQVIERQVQHLVSLVDDLLDVSRIARGKVQIKHDRLDLADVVAKAIEMTSPAIEAGRHRLTVQVPRGLVVEGDAARLAQVVANLLVNSANYSDPGGTMTIEAERRNDRAIVRVADRGHGISAEMLPHVFDLFSQERQELDRSAGGLGLGLAIVRSLVQAHGGTVTADSRGKGQGAVFTVTLPLSGGADAPVERAQNRAAMPVATPGLRILVVDDNPDAAEMLVTALESLGHTARRAFDGPTALDIASHFRPEVALLDLGLPVMDGYELAHRLAASGAADLELVAVTGYGQDVDRERTRTAGFADHLVKPVDLDQLETWLRASQARRQR
jgi:signal transduction histidine kinase